MKPITGVSRLVLSVYPFPPFYNNQNIKRESITSTTMQDAHIKNM